MTIESIGTWAGEVYKALENAPEHTLGMKGLKKATRLKKDEIMSALGWLGREGKIGYIVRTDGLFAASVLIFCAGRRRLLMCRM